MRTRMRVGGTLAFALVLVLGLGAGCGPNQSETPSAPVVTIPAESPSPTPAPTTAPNPALNAQGLAQHAAAGAILHAWCWSFATIEANLDAIAAAGFSAVQTSPIQEVLPGEGGGMQLQDSAESSGNGKWYFQYQPISFNLGNYQLGTEAEFQSMASAAADRGLTVVVDVVTNHMTSDRAAISPEVANLPDVFHNRGQIRLWSSREQVTQYDLLGLADLNTGNPQVQHLISDFLQRVLTAGGTGFRFDGAKHIELPTDDPSFASNYWPTILAIGESAGVFQYLEVLQDQFTPHQQYAALAPVTASDLGKSLRDGLRAGYVSPDAYATQTPQGVPASALVRWVESHDNYANDGTGSQLTEADVALGWAVITATGLGTPLFFSRPDGATADNYWGKNLIGARGSDAFTRPEVAEVNLFRNAMIGTGTRVTVIQGNDEAVLIQRGPDLTETSGAALGAVLVNATQAPIQVSTATALPPGAYPDRVGGGEFQVADGVLTGTLPARSVVVLR